MNSTGKRTTHIYDQSMSSGTTEVLYAEYPYTNRNNTNMNIFTYFMTSGVILFFIYIPYPVITGNIFDFLNL